MQSWSADMGLVLHTADDTNGTGGRGGAAAATTGPAGSGRRLTSGGGASAGSGAAGNAGLDFSHLPFYAQCWQPGYILCLCQLFLELCK